MTRSGGLTNIAPEELNAILKELDRAGLIRVEEKKGLLGRRVEIRSTEAGARELEASVGDMEAKWGEMKALYETKDKEKLRGFMDTNRSFLPMMMFFGIMDMMMFSMMFSMMGASMGSYVPAEDMPGGTGDSGAAGDAGQDCCARRRLRNRHGRIAAERQVLWLSRGMPPPTLCGFGGILTRVCPVPGTRGFVF